MDSASHRGSRGWTFTVMVEIEAGDYFENDSINWQYCMQNATFQHRDDDACEFILHVGSDHDTDGSYYENAIERMEAFGCTKDFVDAYRAAAEEGAIRVLFYV